MHSKPDETWRSAFQTAAKDLWRTFVQQTGSHSLADLWVITRNVPVFDKFKGSVTGLSGTYLPAIIWMICT